MAKTFKMSLIVFFILVFSFNFVFVHATESTDDSVPEVMSELPNEENTEETSQEEVPSVISESASDTSSIQTLNGSSVTKVSNINSYEQANLQLNNILCIILISIGVLLILFAIAILIRLKK